MRRRTRTRGGAARAVLAAAAAAVLAAGCAAGPGADDARGPGPAPRPSGASETGATTGTTGTTPSPGTTGTPQARTGSPLAVKIDNAPAARPQTGLEAADVVYVEPVEGGLSRLMALYATRLPEKVGPVRSARESDLELLRQFDRPTLAFSGAQRKLLPRIEAAPLRAEQPDGSSGAFVRESGRSAPHNLYLRPGRLLDAAPGAAALTTGFTYGAAPSGGRAEKARTVRYPAARFTFTWSGARGRWLVGMDGTPAVEPGGRRPAPATVVVQYVKVRESRFRDFRGSNSPYVETVGTGRAEVLRGGRAYAAGWKRGSATDGTAFTAADGSPVRFAEGPVWVVFAQAG
ncbi:DUF3048 domain-containing protein [Streptomyces daghestanicus]|uniref:DUF3048 domain-containing protein n=1 Tax=Streptomyces daghestanicus TaxID=66885 RepID=UPI00167CE680|nr:DUF3048 domain-containing protein [Streptomyces daghestanicus]